jgi:uncharacterized lipoprotein YajG
MKTLNLPIKYLLACLAVVLCTGCATQKTWVYHSNSYTPATRDTGKSVAVLAYEDARENKNVNLVLLYLIPVMPFGWQDLNSPEGIQML